MQFDPDYMPIIHKEFFIACGDEIKIDITGFALNEGDLQDQLLNLAIKEGPIAESVMRSILASHMWEVKVERELDPKAQKLLACFYEDYPKSHVIQGVRILVAAFDVGTVEAKEAVNMYLTEEKLKCNG